MGRDIGWQLDMERMFDERNELRERVRKNADLYRRDVQFAIDLISDVQAGRITIVRARHDLQNAYERARADELQHWRIT